MTLIEYWNGSAWSIVPSPNRGSGNPSTLYALDAVLPTHIRAVGDAFPTLVERYHDPCGLAAADKK